MVKLGRVLSVRISQNDKSGDHFGGIAKQLYLLVSKESFSYEKLIAKNDTT